MSRRRCLDTNILIQGWKLGRRKPLLEYAATDARIWADELIKVHRTNVITTPVEIEFLCGVTGSHELILAQAYLGRFKITDGGIVTETDWAEARRFAQWVKDESLRRQLGDCLIMAITRRLRLELVSLDQCLPRGNPR